MGTAGSPIQPRASEEIVMPSSCVAARFASRLSTAVFSAGIDPVGGDEEQNGEYAENIEHTAIGARHRLL